MKTRRINFAVLALMILLLALSGCAPKSPGGVDIGGTHMEVGTQDDNNTTSPAQTQPDATTPQDIDDGATAPDNKTTVQNGQTGGDNKTKPDTQKPADTTDKPVNTDKTTPAGDDTPVKDDGPGTVIKIISQNLMNDGNYDNLTHDLKNYHHADTIADARVRQPVLKKVLAPYDADSMGFQEVTWGWKKWLSEAFPAYTQSGVMRYGDNYSGGSANEANTILYKTDKFELVRAETVWLSDTPYVAGTKQWGGSPCTFSYVQLKLKSTGEQIVHFNTRFSSTHGSARDKSGALLSKYVNDFIDKNGDLAMYASGDFNVNPGQTGYNEMIGMFADPVNVTDNVKGSATGNLIDFEDYVANSAPSGGRLDYIFVSPTALVVDKYEVIDKIIDGVRPSDKCGLYLESRIYRLI